MMRITWTGKKTDKEALSEEKGEKLWQNSEQRRPRFVGYALRRGRLEHIVTTGKN